MLNPQVKLGRRDTRLLIDVAAIALDSVSLAALSPISRQAADR